MGEFVTKANANALFQGLKSKPSFTNAITIRANDPEDIILLSARADIRRTLRSAFTGFGMSALTGDLRKSLFEDRNVDFENAARAVKGLDIRFLTQGSHAYKTLIRPAQPEHQEIDLDDGVYLPVPFVNGRPLFSSAGLFHYMELALAPLVREKGWSFERKDTCIRISLSGHDAHIDLPLFAVEHEAFVNLSSLYEKRLAKSFRDTRDSLNEALDSVEARDIRLPVSKIFLADRNEDWRVSDPKLLHDWFEAQVERFGPVLRRVCRYFKGWRDERWDTCKLSSLSIMALCVDVLRDLGERPAENRDDLLVLQIAEALPGKIQKGSIVWREGERALDEAWTVDDRTAFVEAANALAAEVRAALNDTYVASVVISRLQTAFGERFPDAPESVDIKAASQINSVLETKPQTVPMASVGSSVSG